MMDVVERAVSDEGLVRIGPSVAQDEDGAAARALYERLGYGFAHGPYIGGATISGDDSPIHFAAVLVYLTKEL